MATPRSPRTALCAIATVAAVATAALACTALLASCTASAIYDKSLGGGGTYSPVENGSSPEAPAPTSEPLGSDPRI